MKYEQKGLIICGFPGVGKTGAESSATEKKNYEFYDMESTPFRWVVGIDHKRVPNPHFPGCYVDDIEASASKYGRKYTMVSSHKEVRDEMKMRGLRYIIVVPERNLRDEYLLRYVARGSDIGLIEQVYDHWDEWLDDIENDGAPVIHLKSGQFLADVIVPEVIRENLRGVAGVAQELRCNPCEPTLPECESCEYAKGTSPKRKRGR